MGVAIGAGKALINRVACLRHQHPAWDPDAMPLYAMSTSDELSPRPRREHRQKSVFILVTLHSQNDFLLDARLVIPYNGSCPVLSE